MSVMRKVIKVATAAMPDSKGEHERRSLWPELLAGLEWLGLRTSPVYYGVGATRGDGAPVMLVPGFLGSDRSLLEMHRWLGRMGYRSYLTGIGRVADCPDILMDRLLGTIDRAYGETGRPVRLIGHSLGGLLARAAAVRRPNRVSQVITMASPFRRLAAHPFLLALVKLVRGSALERHFGNSEGSCECSFLEALREPLPDTVARAAIYTRSDPVVAWRDCVESDPALNVEVRGSHVGLTINPSVYREVARPLASAERVQRPDRIMSRPETGLQRVA